MLMAFLAVAGSCIQAEMIEEGEGTKVNVHFMTRATSSTDALSHSLDEYRILRVRVLVFESDGSINANHYDDVQTPDLESYTSEYFTVSKLGGKKICVVVNESASLSGQLSHVMDYAELKELTCQLTDYVPYGNLLLMTGDYCLPMYGEVDGVNVPLTYNDVELGVTRCVARVDLYMASTAALTELDDTSLFSVENVGESGYLLPEKSMTATGSYPSKPLSDMERTLNGLDAVSRPVPNEEDLYLSFYMPEKQFTKDDDDVILHLYNIMFPKASESRDYSIKLEADKTAPGKIERNKVYQIYAKVDGPDLMENDIIVKSWELADSQGHEVTGQVNITNCHVVAPGGRVHIPLAEVYKIARDVFGKDLGTTETAAARLLWEEPTGVIADVKQVVSGSGNFSDSYISITTGPVEGNAVVEMQIAGETRWSWHIWNTTYEPNASAGQTTVDGVTSMTRALGATDATSTGLYYQRGRKDPFTMPDINPGAPAAPESTDRGNYLEAVKWSTAFPGRLCINWETFWNSAAGLNYWEAEDHGKGMLDPCPDGWRLPEATAPQRNYWVSAGYTYTNLRCVKDE